MFEDFEKVNKKKWEEKATKDLNGEDVYSKYHWEVGNLTLQPYYAPSDLEKIHYLNHFSNRQAEDDSSGDPRVWINVQRIEIGNESEANKAALEALNNGAEGIEFIIKSSDVDISKLMDNILLEYCHISFHLPGKTEAQLYLDFLKNHSSASKSISFSIESIEATQLLNLLNSIENESEIKLIAVNAKNNLNPSEEIASLLIDCNAIIRGLLLRGATIEKIINSMALTIEIGNDFFLEIAKVRAIRMLFFQLARAYNFDNFLPEDIHIKCISPAWKNENYGPHENMLKNTTAALSAILGGCDSLISIPEKPANLENRIARNVSSIIKEEAFLSKIADPVAGSYFIESVTDQLAEKSWSLFQEELDNETSKNV